MTRFRTSLALAGAVAVATVGQASAQSLAPSGAAGTADCEGGYPSRDITLVVPYSPGGGFDTWARLIAPTLSTHLPQPVNVLVENKSGAGGLLGVTEVYGAAPDGQTIVITEPGVLVTSSIAGTTVIDPTQLRAVGRVAVSPEVIVVSAASPWQTIAEVQASIATDGPVQMAHGGVAAINVVAFEALDLPYEGVFHDGSSESILSIIRGDTDIAVFPYTSLLENIKAGELRPLVIVGTPPSDPAQPGYAEAQGVPTLDEVTGQEGLGAALEQQRIIAAPPGTPDCVVGILSDALVATLADPALVAQAAAADLIPAPLDAGGTQAIIDGTVQALGQYADLIRERVSE